MVTMDSLDRRGPDAAVRGARGRDSLFLMAKLRRAGASESVAVRVRNLSPGGLMAELEEPMDHDAAIEIEVRGLGWIPGRIAWHTEGRTGIAFDRLIDPQRARKPVGAGKADRPFGRS
jgi:hypothetical protein